MFLIAISAVGFGLILASKMNDFQSFPLIMNLIIMPLIFLSSAFYPVSDQPMLLTISYFNPLFYMVDGMRGSLLGYADIVVNPPLVNLGIVAVICFIMLSIGSYLFSRSEM
jgi:ABC-2 type transport system permease protein